MPWFIIVAIGVVAFMLVVIDILNAKRPRPNCGSWIGVNKGKYG